MKKYFILCVAVLNFTLWGALASANPITSLQLPNYQWKWNEKGTVKRSMEVRKYGKMVTITAKHLDVGSGISAKNFINLVRGQMVSGNKAIYKGASFGPVKSKKKGIRDWAFFTIKGKDGRLRQEVWVRKSYDKQMVLAIFTAISPHHKTYKNDFENALSQLN